MVDRFDADVEAEHVALIELNKVLQLLGYFQFDFGMVYLDSQSSVIAKLFCALAKASDHLHVEVVDGVIVDDFLFVFLYEADVVRQPSSPFDHLIDYIIPNRAILKANHIHNAVVFDRILMGQELIDLL